MTWKHVGRSFLRQNSEKLLLYGHPNDDFIISMILIDVAKEICRQPNSFHNKRICFCLLLGTN